MFQTLHDIRKLEKMDQVMIRLPKAVREQARKIVELERVNNPKLTETDIYRTAILNFLSSFSTDSRKTKVSEKTDR